MSDNTYASPLSGLVSGFQQGQAAQRQAALDASNEHLQQAQQAHQKLSDDLLQQTFQSNQTQQGIENQRADAATNLALSIAL